MQSSKNVPVFVSLCSLPNQIQLWKGHKGPPPRIVLFQIHFWNKAELLISGLKHLKGNPINMVPELEFAIFIAAI